MGNHIEVEVRQRADGITRVRVSDNYDAGQWRDAPEDAPSFEADPEGFLAALVAEGNDVLYAALENGTAIDLPRARVEAEALRRRVDAYEEARALESALPASGSHHARARM